MREGRRRYKVQHFTEVHGVKHAGRLPDRPAPKCYTEQTGTGAVRRLRASCRAPRLQAAGLVARRNGLAARLVQRGRLLRRRALRMAGFVPGGAECGACLRRRTTGFAWEHALCLAHGRLIWHARQACRWA